MHELQPVSNIYSDNGAGDQYDDGRKTQTWEEGSDRECDSNGECHRCSDAYGEHDSDRSSNERQHEGHKKHGVKSKKSEAVTVTVTVPRQSRNGGSPTQQWSQGKVRQAVGGTADQWEALRVLGKPQAGKDTLPAAIPRMIAKSHHPPSLPGSWQLSGRERRSFTGSTSHCRFLFLRVSVPILRQLAFTRNGNDGHDCGKGYCQHFPGTG